MATYTFYPEAGDPGSVAIDGTLRRLGQDEIFSTARTSAGTSVNTTGTTMTCAITATTTTNQYTGMQRMGINFDTSSVPDAATVTSATLSLYGTGKAQGLGATDIDIVTFSPTNAADLATGDYIYTKYGTTALASIAYASYSTTGYNDFTIPTTNISKTGVTSLGARLAWDTDNSFGGSWSSGASSNFVCSQADETGTTQDPKLVVVDNTSSSAIKTISGLAIASVKTVNDLAIASVKTVMDLA